MAIKHLTPRTEEELKKADKTIRCDECKKRGKIQYEIKKVYLWKLVHRADRYLCKDCRIKHVNQYILME